MSNCVLATVPWLAAGVPAAPLLAAAGVGLRALSLAQRPPADFPASDAEEPPTVRLALGGALLALVLLLAVDAAALVEGTPGRLVLGQWFGQVTLTLSVDALSLAFSTLVAFIGAVTLAFSRHYLHREPGFHRFFAAMSLFLGGMLLIVLAGNAVLAFVGWEIAGLSSFLLIGYAWDRPTATGNALHAFVTNRVGDAGFLLAIALAYLWLGTAEWPAVTAPGLDPLTARLIALGLVVAALAKSAQLPFSAWIGRALEGPTPSSAIFYGAVMVHAGVYLLLRAGPLLEQVPDVMALLAALGLATAAYGALAGLVQSDVKSALLFATLTQVGLMVAECGFGWFALAAWHMGLHAAWRAYQFLMSPSILELTPKPLPPVPAWLAGRTRLYTAALQRFWLDGVIRALLVRPVQAMGEDARRFDERVLGPLAGVPEAAEREGGDAVIESPGAIGRALMVLADKLREFESRLLWQGGGGPATRVLRLAGEYLRAAEALLEQPRYLLVLVLATFVVIL